MVLIMGPGIILFPVGLIVVFALNGWRWSGYLARLWYVYWGLVLFSLVMLSLGKAWEALRVRKDGRK
jgi:hypothetical protein